MPPSTSRKAPSLWANCRDHLPEYAAEAALVAAFVTIDCLAVIGFKHPASPLAALLPDAWTRRLGVGMVLAAATALLVLSPWGQRSGAHMNPAITLTYLLLRKIRPPDAFAYVAAQALGAFGALLILSLALPAPVMHPAVNYGASMPGPLGETAAFAGEFGIAFVLMFAVLWVSNTPRWARHTPFFVAALVVAFVTWEAPLSGATMDPAFATASDYFGKAWGGWWLYFVAPTIAMPLAAGFYHLTRRRVYCAKLFHHHGKRCIFNCEFPALLAREEALNEAAASRAQAGPDR